MPINQGRAIHLNQIIVRNWKTKLSKKENNLNNKSSNWNRSMNWNNDKENKKKSLTNN